MCHQTPGGGGVIRLGLMLERSREDECPLACPDGARRVLRVHEETVWYLGLPFHPRRAAACARLAPDVLGAADLPRMSFTHREVRELFVAWPRELPVSRAVDASGPPSLFGAVDLPGGIDQADVAERLREVA